MGPITLFKMLPTILLLISLISVEAKPNDRTKRSAQADIAFAPPSAPPPECTADVSCPGGTCAEACNFPFYYNQNTYNRCTTDNSENGKAWCETISGAKVDCNPGCPGVYNPNPNPFPPPPTDVRLRSNGEPEVYINGDYRPICGHFFWDNDNGADLFCKQLNSQYRSGEITSSKYSLQLNFDAVKIGKCRKNDIWQACTGGCNNLQVGGSCEDWEDNVQLEQMLELESHAQPKDEKEMEGERLNWKKISHMRKEIQNGGQSVDITFGIIKMVPDFFVKNWAFQRVKLLEELMVVEDILSKKMP